MDSQNSASYIENDNVLSLEMDILTPELLQLVDASDSLVNSLIYTGEKASNAKKFRVQTFNKAGLAQVRVTATFMEGEVARTLEKVLNVTVLSGPVSAMSIIYVASSYALAGQDGAGLFTDSYTIHAVDRYNNPVNTGQSIYVGAINGIKNYSTNEEGSISTVLATGTMFDLNRDLNSSVQVGDSLVVLSGQHSYDPSYMGGWNIEQYSDSTDSLILAENYSGASTDKLNYAIGGSMRPIGCGLNTVSLIDIDAENGEYTISEDGTATVRLQYDPLMVGRDVFLFANSAVDGSRVGVSTKHTLTGTGVYGEATCDGKVSPCTISFSVGLNDSGYYVLNNNIPHIGVSSGECNVTVLERNTGCSGMVKVFVEVPGETDNCTVSASGVSQEYTSSF